METSLSSAEWERAWQRTQSKPWRTLAVLPADAESSDAALELAKRLVELGAEHGEDLDLANFRQIRLKRVASLLDVAEFIVSGGVRLVFATTSIEESPSAAMVARAADCVILCASLGGTRLRAVEDAVEQIGKERFLGSILFRIVAETSSLSPSESIVVRAPEGLERVP